MGRSCCEPWYMHSVSEVSATRKRLWWVGASISGLSFLSLIAAYWGIAIAGRDLAWINPAGSAFVGGLVVQSISFLGRPRSLSVLLAWLCVAVGMLFAVFGFLNLITLLCFGFAQLVMMERYRKPPEALPGAAHAHHAAPTRLGG